MGKKDNGDKPFPKEIVDEILDSSAGRLACKNTELNFAKAKKEITKIIASAWPIALDAVKMPHYLGGSRLLEDEKRNLLRLSIPKKLCNLKAREALIDEIWKYARSKVNGYKFFLGEVGSGGIALERTIKYAAEDLLNLRKFRGSSTLCRAYRVEYATKHICEIIKTGEIVAETRGPVTLAQREEFIKLSLCVAGVHVLLAETIAHLYVGHFRGRP